jgi:L-lactate dehydrogenase (cytochrome)
MMGVYRTLRSVIRFEELELDPVARRLRRAADVEDLRKIAKRRLPHGVFDYIDGAAEDERTYAANTEAFRRRTFKPRVLRDVSQIDTSTTLLGKRIPMPLVLSPTGFARIADPEGELAVARAADRVGVPFTLSTIGTRSIEEIAAVNHGPKWFQLYVFKDRGLVKELVERTKAAGYEAITLTVDTAVIGRRERDIRRGFTLPPKIGPGTIIDGALHPGWTWAFVRAEPIVFSNVAGKDVGDGTDAVSLADYINGQFDPSLCWDDIEWLKSIWDGPLLIKGIQSVADAELAVEVGVDAVQLSNHGGRQLDTSPAVLDLVEPVVQAVGDQLEVICDGGVRRGSDIVKALALGAKAVSGGRIHFYALGAGGERGVDHVLGLLEAGLRRTMALVGATSVDDITRDLLE